MNIADKKRAREIIETELGGPGENAILGAMERLIDRIATAIAEERDATFRQAIQLIADTPVVIDRTVVKRASDANGWYCAAEAFTKRLKDAIRTP